MFPATSVHWKKGQGSSMSSPPGHEAIALPSSAGATPPRAAASGGGGGRAVDAHERCQYGLVSCVHRSVAPLVSRTVNRRIHHPSSPTWGVAWVVARVTGNTASEELLRSQFPRTFSTHVQVHLRVDPAAASTQAAHPPRPLRVGVVLSGGPAPGGHNVVAGLLDALEVWSLPSQNEECVQSDVLARRRYRCRGL